MAAQAILAEQVTINSVDWTALGLVKGAVLAVDVDQLDPTAMGTGWKRKLGGLREGTLTVNMVDDVAASSIDSLLAGLIITPSTVVNVPFEVRLSSAAVGVNNPKYTGSILPATFNLGGQVGELAMKSSLAFPVDGVVTRATS